LSWYKRMVVNPMHTQAHYRLALDVHFKLVSLGSDKIRISVIILGLYWKKLKLITYMYIDLICRTENEETTLTREMFLFWHVCFRQYSPYNKTEIWANRP
jgi:hypothetical protein